LNLSGHGFSPYLFPLSSPPEFSISFICFCPDISGIYPAEDRTQVSDGAKERYKAQDSPGAVFSLELTP